MYGENFLGNPAQKSTDPAEKRLSAAGERGSFSPWQPVS